MKELIDHLSSLLLVAGLSGAGKSSVANFLSDQGYFTIENLPVALIRNFLEHSKANPERFVKTAILVDISSRESLNDFLSFLDGIDARANQVKVLFVDCHTPALLKRYSETRRPHPGFDPERDRVVEDSIERERSRLAPLKEVSDSIIDTSEMTVHELRREVQAFLASLGATPGNFTRVNFISFGFRYGVPASCDLLLDVRFLPNPYFVEALKEKSGLDPQVASYVTSSEDSQQFLAKSLDLLSFLLPRYVKEGKSYVNIGIGCTGGKHRSVAIAETLSKRIEPGGCHISIKHRDVEK